MIHNLTKIVRKEGQSNTGRIWLQINIQTQETGSQQLTGFENETNTNWQVGDQIDIEITQIEKYGMTFYNYSVVEPEIKTVLTPEVAKQIEDYHNQYNAMVRRIKEEAKSLKMPPF